jgi:NAD(P)-dependent dehydrogenase (short-subunit alcohol dehydrogenase family)
MGSAAKGGNFMNTFSNLKGKVAVVTGGGGVLCGEMAKELAARGMKVAVLSRKLENAESVVKEIKEAGGEAVAVACDILDKKSIEKANQEIQQHYSSYHLLINGAGGNHPDASTSSEAFSEEDVQADDKNSFFDLTEEGVKRVFDLNFTGTVMATQVFMRHMLSEKGASVINISSMSAYSPMTKVMSYSAAKAGIDNFTKWLAVHMAPKQVRCNAIAPGFFLTRQNENLLLDENGQPTPRAEKIISQTPEGRFGKPEELIGTLLWLADQEMSGFVNGVTIPVDGGFMAYSGV